MLGRGKFEDDGGEAAVEATPFLRSEEVSKEDNNNDVDLDISESVFPRGKSHNWTTSNIILGFTCLESISFSGIATNLVIYLSSVLRENNKSIATSITTWTGTCYLIPFIGALIADACWGSYKMILFSSFIYLPGLIMITFSSLLPILYPPLCKETTCSALSAQRFIFYSGLYLIAAGSGGVKSSLLPLGADQFDDNNLIESQRKASFFNWFYFCMNVGSLVSSTLIVWIQENVSWTIGYGAATLCLAFALGSFLCGRSCYRVRKPGGSPIKKAFQVLVASVRKHHVRVPSDGCLLYEAQEAESGFANVQRLAHTDDFRFLDKAAVVCDSDSEGLVSPSPWVLCSVTQVEELKMLLRLFPIWITGTIFSISFSQTNTTFVEQGKSMETRLGSFNIPPASLFAFELLSVMLWVLLYDRVITPLAVCFMRNRSGLTQLQRMGVGYFLIILAMGTAAVLETKRLDNINADESLTIMWQMPQYFLVAGSEVFTYIGQLEFFYNQGPDTMRSMSTAISLLTISLGNYLNSLVVYLVTTLTAQGDSPGWISDDLNKGHLDYFFALLAGIGVVNLLIYLTYVRKSSTKEIAYRG